MNFLRGRLPLTGLAGCLLLVSSALAQNFEFFPGAKYDPSIPTLKQIVGHDWGEKITMSHEAARYIQALEQAAGPRLKVVKYAETWEGRPLYVLAIGSAPNIARIEEIKS